MLSYQHIYHASNPADIHKHALLCSALAYLSRKSKPFTYIETHSGRGLYQLDAPEAQKTGEAQAGQQFFDKLSHDHPYVVTVDAIRERFGAPAYPGSPMLAAELLRADDKMHLAEKHPGEFSELRATISSRAKCYCEDGFTMAHKVCPPQPRRGMMLIDPSFEVKSDYETIPTQIVKLHRKWNVGVIALWYPILTSGAHVAMLGKLESAGLPKPMRHEVRFPPVREGHRMLGSGLFMINTPFGMEKSAEELSVVFGAADTGLKTPAR